MSFELNQYPIFKMSSRPILKIGFVDDEKYDFLSGNRKSINHFLPEPSKALASSLTPFLICFSLIAV